MKVSTLVNGLVTVASLMSFADAQKKPSRTWTSVYFGTKDEVQRCRIDPIVNPGGVAGHLHSIFGGNAFGPSMPGDAATKATCTTAKFIHDKSNYWVPSLFFRHKNGKLEPVKHSWSKVYYFFEATDDTIEPFPPGFRMRSGDPTLRAPPKAPINYGHNPDDGPINPARWTCPRSDKSQPLYPPNSDGTKGVGVGVFNGEGKMNEGEGYGFPYRDCDGTGMRMDIHFPSCFNPAAGVENWKESMAWPRSVHGKGQICPEGWMHLPHVFLEAYWDTGAFRGKWEEGNDSYQPWVLSNGDTTGFSLHADFLNGWPEDVMRKLINGCNSGNAGVHKCPGFANSEPSSDYMDNCKVDCTLPEGPFANYGQTFDKLPGNNPITGYSSTPVGAPNPDPVPVATTTAKPPVNKPQTTFSTKSKPTTVAIPPYQPPPQVTPRPDRVTTTTSTRIAYTTKTVVVESPRETVLARPKKTCNRGRKKVQKAHGRHNHKRHFYTS